MEACALVLRDAARRAGGVVRILVGTLVLLPLFHQELLCSFAYGKSSKTTQLLRHQQPASVLLRVE